jgi:hypothetical protein
MRRKAEAISYEEEASLEEDMWDDGDDYRRQPVNIPKKQAMPEYDYE